MAHINIGDRVWVPHEERAWVWGRVQSIGTAVTEIKTDIGVLKVKASEVSNLQPCGSHVDSVMENLVDLDELSEGAILHHVRKRMEQKKIYTHVGNILVAVNPFEFLPIYGEKDIQKAAQHTTPYPHVFVTAATAYNQLRTNLKNQSVLISGESGAGKTETTKKVLSYLANVAPGESDPTASSEIGMEEKILQSNPLLEALGNAKTLRNSNSSRFGKWMKVGFESNFLIQGCEIINYLLEKSRVVDQSTQERNYHIFYQLIAGADPAMKKRLHLQDPMQYEYLNKTGCMKIEGVNDAKDFEEVQEAMNTLQFSPEVCESMYSIISAILLLGNVGFSTAGGSDSSEVSSSSAASVEKVVGLLGVDTSKFQKSLIEKVVTMGGKGEEVTLNLSAAQANDSRDSLTKFLYSNMFDWTIKRVNKTLSSGKETPYSIGILDIFGFEVFDTNRFEQLCINYANEKLQLHFNEVIFNEELKMYAEDGVSADKIEFVDNAKCVMLIEGKPFGLISLLDEECSLGASATDISYVNKAEGKFGKGKSNENLFFVKHRTKKEIFSVKHFAGSVDYNVYSFLEKNRDSLSVSTREVMLASTNPFVSDLFKESEEAVAATSGKGSKKSGKLSLGSQFRAQLIGLITSLKLTEPHFVRCVKPNHEKKPNIFTGPLALRQLRYAGLFEAVRIRQSGFAYRVTHDIFARQYSILYDGLMQLHRSGKKSSVDTCRAIFDGLMKDKIVVQAQWYVGNYRVFLKTSKIRSVLEQRKATRVVVYCVRMQALIRAFITRCKTNAAKYEKQKLLAAEKEEQMKEQRAKEKIANLKKFSAIVVQKYFRRHLIKKAMMSMQDLILLRQLIAKRDLEQIQQTVGRIHDYPLDSMFGNAAALFKRDVSVAKTMCQLMSIQNNFIATVENAIDHNDVPELNRLIVKSTRLELLNHPTVKIAQEHLTKLHQKRKIIKCMVDFLRNENEYGESIQDIIKEAKELRVDPDFVMKVQKVYEAAGPRLRGRHRLRRAIETIHGEGMRQGIQEALGLQAHYPRFAELEIRAAEAILRLLMLEAEMLLPTELHTLSTITKKSSSNTKSNLFAFFEAEPQEEKVNTDSQQANPEETGEIRLYDDAPRLTDEIIRLCEKICSSSCSADPGAYSTRSMQSPTKSPKKKMSNSLLSPMTKTSVNYEFTPKQQLQVLLDHSELHLEAVIRWYKWSKLYSVWNYPEASGVSLKQNEFEEENFDVVRTKEVPANEEFYGLRVADTRTNIHLIRSLHRDINPTYGEAPASMQAALGSLHLSSDVTDYLLHMEQEKEKYKQKAALDTNMKKTKDAKDKTTRAKGKSAKENDTRSFPDNQLPSSCRMSLSQATLMRQQRSLTDQSPGHTPGRSPATSRRSSFSPSMATTTTDQAMMNKLEASRQSLDRQKAVVSTNKGKPHSFGKKLAGWK